MVLVSSADFATHQEKYLNMAMDREIHIKSGQNMFRLVYEPAITEQPILEPDEDLRRAITAEELLVGIHEDIRRKFASRV